MGRTDPAERIDLLRAVPRGDRLVPAGKGVVIEQPLPRGHVLTALVTARRLGLDRLLPRHGPPQRCDLAPALIVARLFEPVAKLATARALDPATASHSPGAALDLGRVTAKEVHAALDWLENRIETALARRHLGEGTLVLYDLTSTPPSPGQAFIWRAAAARWPGTATATTTARTSGRSLWRAVRRGWLSGRGRGVCRH